MPVGRCTLTYSIFAPTVTRFFMYDPTSGHQRQPLHQRA